jgi:hypothetical protein
MLIGLIGVIVCYNRNVKAAEPTNITIRQMVQMIMNELDIQVQDANNYLPIAVEKGLIGQNEFDNIYQELTKTEAALLLERADRIKNNYDYRASKLLENSNYLLDNSGDTAAYIDFTETKNINNIVETVSGIPYECTQTVSQAHTDVIRNILLNVFPNEDITIKTINLYKDNMTKYIIGIKDNEIKSDSPIIALYNKAKTEKKFKEFILLHKRLSDISDIDNLKQDAISYCFRRGYLDSKTNGKYSQSRKFNGTDKLSEKEAKVLIDRLDNPKKRLKISPDGQLIRTKNLPKNAEDYEYILDAFPNSFYEMCPQFISCLSDHKAIPHLSYKKLISNKKCLKDKNMEGWYVSEDKLLKESDCWNYETPAKIKKGFWGGYSLYDHKYHYTSGENVINLFDDGWCDLVERYLNTKFNVNYKTMNNRWMKKMAALINYAGQVDDYALAMKKNKVILETKKIVVEPSTIYSAQGSIFVRAYIKFRVKSAKSLSKLDDVFLKDVMGSAEGTKISNLKIGQWKELYLDIPIGALKWSDYEFLPDLDSYAVCSEGMNDYFMKMKMKGPVANYKQVKIISGEYKGYYKWVYKK